MGLAVLFISFVCFGALTVMFPAFPFDAEVVIMWKTEHVLKQEVWHNCVEVGHLAWQGIVAFGREEQ